MSRDPALSPRAQWCLFAVAVVLRLLHLLAIRETVWFEHPIIDAATYDDAARAIAAGRGHPDRIFWQPPGYTYFLGAIYALSGGSHLAARLVQAALGGVTAVLTARIGALLFGRGVGLAAGYGAAAYGTLIYFDGTLLAPPVAIPLLLAAVWLALRAQRRGVDARLWAGAGALTGLAALATANALVLAPVFAWFARGRWWVVLVSTLVAVLPATWRNATRGGEPVLISYNAGINLHIGNNPRYEETVAVRPDLQWKRLSAEPLRYGIRGAIEGSNYFGRRVLRYAASDPAGFLLLQLKKTRLLLGGDEIYRNHAIYPERANSPVLAALLWKVPGIAFPFGALLPLAALGLAVGARRAPLAVAVLAAYALSVIAFFIAARYRLPLVPLLLVFAAEGGRWLWRGSAGRRRIAGLVGVAAVYVVANVGQGRMETRMNADAEFSVGVRLALAGRIEEARRRFQTALEQRPEYAEAWANLGVLDAKQGRSEAAERAFRRAVELEPENPATLTNLAVFCEKSGRAEEALGLYGRALAADPTDQVAAVASRRLAALRDAADAAEAPATP
jgi:tetratricopeptide (TPR) repeat protein